LSLAEGKNFVTEKQIFQALKKFSKKSVFMRKNLWKLLDARDFEISVKFCFF
jgi:hypothetical protein